MLPAMSLDHPVIAVVGAGAVGGYYGAMLARGGYDVHFLLRADYAVVRERGWAIKSYQGDFTLPPNAVHVYDDPTRMPKADLVIVALKATNNHLFPQLLSPLIKSDTAIVTMQNGLGNEEDLADLFGGERVMGGMAFVCNNRLGPGVIHHMSEGWVRLGEFIGKPTARTRRICELFTTSGVECQSIEDLRHGRWQKILWNIPFNGLGTIMDLSTDRLIGTPEGLGLVTSIMREALSIAAAMNLHWPDDFIEKKIEMTRGMGAYRTSMQIDRAEGRPLEIEAIVGRPLRVARELGIAAPEIEMLYRMLKVL